MNLTYATLNRPNESTTTDTQRINSEFLSLFWCLQDSKEVTPLIAAVTGSNLRIVEMLLEADADVTRMTVHGEGAVHLACTMNEIE